MVFKQEVMIKTYSILIHIFFQMKHLIIHNIFMTIFTTYQGQFLKHMELQTEAYNRISNYFTKYLFLFTSDAECFCFQPYLLIQSLNLYPTSTLWFNS